MRKCPHCRETQPDPNNPNCTHCGQAISNSATSQSDTDPDFKITEANPDHLEFVGGKAEFTRDEEDLEIEAPITSAADDTTEESSQLLRPLNDFPTEEPSIVGRSAPYLPLPRGEEAKMEESHLNLGAQSKKELDTMQSTSELKKLSPDELESIEKRMYRDQSYLDDREKEALIKKINSIKPTDKASPDQGSSSKTSVSGSGPATETTPEFSQPEMAEHGKGDAYFYKNFVQLSSSQELHVGDELLVRGRVYNLKPKQLISTITYAAAGLLFTLILIFVGSLFTRSDENSGKGTLAGLILDQNNQPWATGATVRLPETGATVSSGPLGFFDAGEVEAGSHRVELIIDGQLVKSDYATVTGGQLTLMTLTPSKPARASSVKPKITKPPVPVAAIITQPEEQIAPPEKPQKKSVQSAPKPGHIRLSANVDGARFTVGGRTLGAGNLVYNKIKPGRHKYTVELNGYESVRGTVTVKPGKTASLKVTLKPIEKAVLEEVDPKELLLADGTAALRKGNYAAAESAFSDLLILQPDNYEALLGRAQAHQYRGNKEDSYIDYLAAGDALKNRKDHNRSATAYTNAIRMNGGGINAYLGRADLYLARGEAIAATADYEAVKRLDKRNARAYFGLGQARFRLGNYKKAIKHFKDARSLDKKNPLVYQYLMLSYLAVDDSKNVRKSFEKFKNYASDSELDRLLSNKDYSEAVKVARSD